MPVVEAGKVGVGFWGFGGIAQNRLLGAVTKSPFCRFVGAHDMIMTVKGTELIQSCNGKIFRNPEEMLASEKIGMVIVVTPHEFHFRHTMAVLEAGKHAFTEKPLDTTDKAYLLTDKAREKGLALVVDSLMKNNALNIWAAEKIGQGLIGDVIRVETNMEFYYDDFRNFRWREDDDHGGGPAWDVGPHCLYMAMMLTGTSDLNWIEGTFGRSIHPNTIPHQSIKMSYGLGDGILGTSNCSFITHMPSYKADMPGFEGVDVPGFEGLLFRVFGTKGIIEGFGTMFQHSVTYQEGNDMHLVVHDKDGRYEIRTTNLERQGIVIPDIYLSEIERAVRPIALREKELPVDTEAVKIVDYINEALRSAKRL